MKHSDNTKTYKVHYEQKYKKISVDQYDFFIQNKNIIKKISSARSKIVL